MSATHSVAPAVEIDAVGRDLDIPVITLNLEAGAIARTMVRTLGRSLAFVNGTYWLRLAGAGEEFFTDRVISAARGRGTFAPQLDLDAARALHEALGAAIEVAETSCRVPGCPAIGLVDGACPPHHEAADRPVVRAS